MTILQRSFTALVLAFAFTMSAIAGDMQTGSGVASLPPPAPSSSMAQGGANGQLPTGPGATTEGGAWSEVVWGVVEGVLALL